MTSVKVDLNGLEQELRGDPEFTLTRRFWDAKIRIIIGESQSFQIVIRDGVDVVVDPIVTPFDGFDIQLAGTEEHWTHLLAPIAPAFYQDFWPAMVHHGFKIEGDMEMIYAFLPAIRRLGDIFRIVAAQEVVA